MALTPLACALDSYYVKEVQAWWKTKIVVGDNDVCTATVLTFQRYNSCEVRT